MGVLILLLLIPALMIQSLIREREYHQQEAIREVSGTWSFAQMMAKLATINLVTVYTRSIFANRTLSLLTGGVLLALYGFVLSSCNFTSSTALACSLR